ncbi:MAG: sterol desaturase family protein [Chitinophagaceae bacterium]
MHFEKIKNRGQARLFESQYLEILTKTHPLVIWGLYLPIIVFMLYYSNVNLGFNRSWIVLNFFGGLIFWSFFEYMMHRYLFHFSAQSPLAKKFIYILHGNHHEFPRDKERLFMPPVPSLILSSVIFSLQYLPLGKFAFIFFPGFMVGYLLYGSMHYAIHAGSPPFKFFKPLWRNHHLHHYKSDEKGFGVSTSFWDHVFNTHFECTHQAEEPQKVKDLMFNS